MNTIKSKPVQIDDFQGMATNLDTHERPPGVALEAWNATMIEPGKLVVRAGCRDVEFEN